MLEREGRDALSTRSVAAAAGVQAPAIYRHFGDKQGLLDAVAEHGVAEYLAGKRSLAPTADPLRLLREGWDLHVAFGLSKPAFYLLIYTDPRPEGSPAARQAEELLRAAFAPLAAAGRLGVSIDRATHLMQAAGVGVVLTLIAQPEDRRDLGLSPMALELVLSAVVVDTPEASAETPALGSALATLGHALEAGDDDALAPLTGPERALMAQWVARLQAG